MTSPAQPRRVGRLDGRLIDLDEAPQALSREELERVEEELPDGSLIRPWRFAGDGSKCYVRADGVLMLD